MARRLGHRLVIYEPEMTLAEARAEYFRQNDFGEDGGYNERWIKVKVWRIPIWLPNTAGRVQAVKLHDLHHVLTEYPTTRRGEAEISAWEIGSGGLQKFWAGWWLDLMNVAQGLLIKPAAFTAVSCTAVKPQIYLRLSLTTSCFKPLSARLAID